MLLNKIGKKFKNNGQECSKNRDLTQKLINMLDDLENCLQ